jgi:transcription-repair coupling factor (superfamily II helicase)
MNREGQVFYLHNRVFDIDAVALRLRALLPKARIVVGHGQMPADELEEVMARFVNGDADVLLSTTIIESGLDIPNANTIIIDRADRFGLSDLYQLRGRVGRYKHQAFAYLLLPRHAGLLTDARKRISAIKQYSTLGSGFKIAMRDLEIRGAGNLLGAQQSGHITAVGFELYCQLLKQSISALKGEKVKPSLDVEVRLDFLALSPAEESGRSEPASEVRRRRPATPMLVPRETASYITESGPEDGEPNGGNRHSGMRRWAAYIPLKYVSDSRQRIEVYRKLAEVMDDSELETLRAQLRDRFGPLPPALQLLLEVGKLKLLGRRRDIAMIETKGDKLMLTRDGDYITPDGKFPRLTKKEPKARLREIKRFIDALT